MMFTGRYTLRLSAIPPLLLDEPHLRTFLEILELSSLQCVPMKVDLATDSGR